MKPKADKTYKKGTIFVQTDDMTSIEKKALDWMIRVQTTPYMSKANLCLLWVKGRMVYKSTRNIKRGQKFVLFEGSGMTSGINDNEKSQKSDTEESQISDNEESQISDNEEYCSSSEIGNCSESESYSPKRRSSRLSRSIGKYYEDSEDDDLESVKKVPAIIKSKSDSEMESDSEHKEPIRLNYVDSDDGKSKDSSYKQDEIDKADTESEGNEFGGNRRIKRRKLDDSIKNGISQANDGENQSLKNDSTKEENEINCRTCQICLKVFSDPQVFQEHKKKHYTQIKMYECDVCEKSFVYEKSLKEHLKADHKKKDTKNVEESQTPLGNKTDVSEKNKKDLKNRITKPGKNEQNKFACDECGKEFRWQSSFDEHKSIHRKEFVCKICDKVFGKQIFLENHEFLHKNDKEKKHFHEKKTQSKSRSSINHNENSKAEKSQTEENANESVSSQTSSKRRGRKRISNESLNSDNVEGFIIVENDNKNDSKISPKNRSLMNSDEKSEVENHQIDENANTSVSSQTLPKRRRRKKKKKKNKSRNRENDNQTKSRISPYQQERPKKRISLRIKEKSFVSQNSQEVRECFVKLEKMSVEFVDSKSKNCSFKQDESDKLDTKSEGYEFGGNRRIERRKSLDSIKNRNSQANDDVNQSLNCVNENELENEHENEPENKHENENDESYDDDDDFKCHHCGMIYMDELSWLSHMKKSHPLR